MPDKQPRKVAILGGGVGAVTAAFALTSTEELRQTYEVTVYTCGWRLGGKGASGRNASLGQRIEEHGLHIWFGFYDNAFRLMRQCYEELGRPAGSPLATLEQAFSPRGDALLFDRQGSGWAVWNESAPANDFPVGGIHELPTFWEIVEAIAGWLRHRWERISNSGDRGKPVPKPHLPSWIRDVALELDAELSHILHADEHLLGLVERLARVRVERPDTIHEERHRDVLCRLLGEIKKWAWDAVRERVEAEPEVRWWFGALDLGVTTLSGILADDLLEKGFDVVDNEELSAWLKRHGALPVTIGTSFGDRAPLLRAIYDMVFAFEGGDPARPNLAAGSAIHGSLRLMFTYMGSLYWKMQAGMGDTIFMPYYEVLTRRGVRFEFFQWVKRLGLSADRKRVAEIEVIPQARGNEAYKPEVDVNGLPCWPSEPLLEQLEDSDRLARDAAGRTLEAGPGPLGLPVILLRDGIDFDHVVLGISLGALPPSARSWQPIQTTPDSPRCSKAFRRWPLRPSNFG